MHTSIRFDPKWSPGCRYDRLDDVHVGPGASTDFELRIGKLIYACRFQMRFGADRMFVSLRSSRGSPLELPPVFYSPHSAVEMDAYVLAVSDPSLFLDAEIEIGLFYGTREQDAVLDLIQIAEKIASSVGLDRSRIVYWGSSGAAMGAVMAAVKSGACAVLVNPQLDAINMGGSHLADAVAKVFGANSYDDITSEFPLRSRAPVALQAALASGLRPKLLIVQNMLDETFNKRQFIPFCRLLDVPLQGGWDPTGTIKSMVYSDPAGHGLDNDELRIRILTDGVPALLGPNRSSSAGSQKGYNVLVTKSGHHTYEIPAGTELVRLTSNPTFVGADVRRLGAAVKKITVDGYEIPISDPSLFQGFYAVEHEGERSWRWTDGAATVPLMAGPTGKRFELDIEHVASDSGES